MGYVSPALREFWERRDPIRLFRDYLLGGGGFGQDEIEALDAECVQRVEQAVLWAEAQPLPAPDSAASRLFAP
jgi:TPP-dependent pyruvate/acetoin dehydrogenase alpha subunit